MADAPAGSHVSQCGFRCAAASDSGCRAREKQGRVFLRCGFEPMDAGKCWGFGLSKQQGPNSGRKSSMTRNRGLNDILITVVGGLHGFPGAIESVYPQTQSNLPSI